MSGTRISARVVLLDEDGSVLLLCGSDPALDDSAPRWWFTVGGQARPGEPLVATAVRELAEETGLQAAADRIIAGRPYLAKTNIETRHVLPAGSYGALRDLIYVVPPQAK